MSSTATIPASLSSPSPSAARPNRAVLLLDGNPDAAAMQVRGWSRVLANAPVAALYEPMLADIRASCSGLVAPEEARPALEEAGQMPVPRSAIATYNGLLRARCDWLAAPSDSLCVLINARRFPVCNLAEALALHRLNRCDVTLIDFDEARGRSYEERMLVGGDGCVQCVYRCYDGASPLRVPPQPGPDEDWPALAVLSPLLLQRLLAAGMPDRLSHWPALLLRGGLHVSCSAIPGACFDMADARQLQPLSDAILRHRPQWLCQASGLSPRSPRIWTGSNVRIAPAAQLIGPVAIGDDVEIGAGALVVGPAVIGRGASLGRNVVLKRAVVAPGVVLAAADAETQGGARSESASDAHPMALPPSRPVRLQMVLETPALGGFHYRVFRFTKRIMDIVGASVLLAITLPFYPLIALAIKLSSPGPVFYVHVRQGRGGRNFPCLKFRTMVSNAEQLKRDLARRNEVDGPQFKIRQDPRVFPVGRWLRRLNIDEWPQFLNVLAGQMSLVGPRPSPEAENQMCPSWREARLSVRPGVTGLWQVMRRRGEADFQEWIYYDVQYVRSQSTWLDIRILLKTLRVMLRGN